MATLVLRGPHELQGAIMALEREATKAVERSLVRAGQYGRTVMQALTKRQDARGSGAYGASFITERIKGGAMITNTARHSLFVERGRRPGRAPPLDPIIEWVKAKGFAKTALKKARQRRRAASGKSRVRRKPGPKKMKGRIKGARIPRKPSAATARYLRLFSHQIARRVQRKIAKRGTKPHWIFKRSLPKIAKKAKQLSKQELRKVFRSPPRK